MDGRPQSTPSQALVVLTSVPILWQYGYGETEQNRPSALSFSFTVLSIFWQSVSASTLSFCNTHMGWDTKRETNTWRCGQMQIKPEDICKHKWNPRVKILLNQTSYILRKKCCRENFTFGHFTIGWMMARDAPLSRYKDGLLIFSVCRGKVISYILSAILLDSTWEDPQLHCCAAIDDEHSPSDNNIMLWARSCWSNEA